MNKRILKLFNEAGFHQPEMERLGIEDKFEKFAELIVRECAKVAWYHTPDTEELEYSHLIKDKVLQHFGVEE